MIETIKWKEVYSLWKYGTYRFPELLTDPIPVETVFVVYNREGYIYGFDWLSNEDARRRKQLIEKDPLSFLYFTRPSNKGTIQTAEMLVNAKDKEEQAAIWIAATAKELSGGKHGNSIWRYANLLETAAWEFLGTRYYLWHHAMKRLVPDIMIPRAVLENIKCEDVEPVIGLIQMNTILLRSTWSVLRYTSLKDGDFPECNLRKNGKDTL